MCDVMMTLIASSHQSSLRERYHTLCSGQEIPIESFLADPHSRSHFEDL